jgi:hypothetical protein
MRKLFHVLFLLLASLSAYAQNWNPLNPGAKRYFTNANGYLKGMRIDSVIAYGNELHYYPFKTLRFYPDSYSIGIGDTAGSWLGEDVIKRTDGTFLFPNYWGDTIRVKPLADIGDSWTFYSDSSTVYYNAEVTAIDTMTILGSIDSVKKIVLTAYSGITPLLTDSFNNAEIVLSKGHGFYATMELYMFPFHAPGAGTVFDDHYLVNSMRPHDLTDPYGQGTTTPIPGQQSCMFRLTNVELPGTSEFCDWTVGDVYEYSSCMQSDGDQWGCTTPATYQLDTVISKTVVSGGVEYGRKGWKAVLDQQGNSNILYYFLSPHTDTVFFPGSSSLDVPMPEEFIAPSWYGSGEQPVRYRLTFDTSYCSMSPMFYSLSFVGGLPGYKTYNYEKAGIGNVHRNWLTYEVYEIVTDSQLIYSVRNGVPCGTFFMPDTTVPVTNYITNINERSAVSIYPNPATEQLTIETGLSHYDLSLINAVGQIVYRRPGCDSKQVIDVSGLASGVYQLRMDTEMGDVLYRKLVVQH